MRACLPSLLGRHIHYYYDDILRANDDNSNGKAWGLYQAIKWISLLGYQKVFFELGRKLVVDDIPQT